MTGTYKPDGQQQGRPQTPLSGRSKHSSKSQPQKDTGAL